MKKLLLPYLACALTCLGASLHASVQQEEVLNSSSHKKLAKPIESWLEAKSQQQTEDQLEAREDLNKVMDSVSKSAKGKEVLSLVRDWAKALQIARGGIVPRASKGKTVVRENAAGSVALYVPKSYNPKKGAVPLVVLLGSTNQDIEESIDKLPAEILNAYAVACPDLSGLTESDFLATSGRQRIVGLGVGVPNRELLLDWNRVVLVGMDEGAVAAAHYGTLLPFYFAGVGLVGAEAPSGLAEANAKMCKLNSVDDLAGLATWITGLESRDPDPLEFELALTERWAGRAYWVQATKFDDKEALQDGKTAMLKVSVDRSTNTITLVGEHVYEVNLYLNDVIVDLDKPVNIVRNSQPYQYQPARSVGSLLDNYWGRGLDASSIYPAVVRGLEFPVPEGAKE